MTEHDDQIYLEHIADMSAALNQTARRGKEAFLSDPDPRDATIYRLQTLAESTQRLSAEFKAAHPEIPCADIARFRDRAVHRVPWREPGYRLGHRQARHPRLVSTPLETSWNNAATGGRLSNTTEDLTSV